MKNKKLIATVASLCLVLVAVVAAVIGVLAAQTQNVKSKIKVGYTATNVGATVSIKSRSQYGSWDGAEQATTTFYTGDKSKTETLAIDSAPIALAWETSGDNDGELNYYAVYRFTFTNTSANNAMKVSVEYDPSYEENSQSKTIENNVTLKWYQTKTVAAATFAKPTYTNNTTFSAIETPTGLTLLTVPTDGTKTQCLDSIATNNQVGYVYLVVLISNVDADASFDMTNHGNITFVLDAIANS